MAIKLKQEFYDGTTLTKVYTFDTEQEAIDFQHSFQGNPCAYEIWEEV